MEYITFRGKGMILTSRIRAGAVAAGGVSGRCSTTRAGGRAGGRGSGAVAAGTSAGAVGLPVSVIAARGTSGGTRSRSTAGVAICGVGGSGMSTVSAMPTSVDESAAMATMAAERRLRRRRCARAALRTSDSTRVLPGSMASARLK
jgi:hypothetical protein